MSIILARIFVILFGIAFVGFIWWFITLPERIDREFKRRLMYGDDTPVFRLEKGVLVIDYKTFSLSHVKRFLAKKFSKAIIVLGGGKELCFYNGIRAGMFMYEGKLSVIEELQYQAIKEHLN